MQVAAVEPHTLLVAHQEPLVMAVVAALALQELQTPVEVVVEILMAVMVVMVVPES